MRKLTALSITAAALAATSVATPAGAAVVQCYVTGPNDPKCANTSGTNVLNDSMVGPRLINTVINSQTNVSGTFTSSTDDLNMGASGQAVVTPTTGLLNQLSYNALGFTFTTATFNLIGTGDVAIDGFVFGIDSTGTDFTRAISGSGQNFTGITTTGGDVLTGFSLSSTGGFERFEQLRLAGVQQIASVPEPATWALMLLGFGGMGVAMRRSRRTTVLQQMA